MKFFLCFYIMVTCTEINSASCFGLWFNQKVSESTRANRHTKTGAGFKASSKRPEKRAIDLRPLVRVTLNILSLRFS